MDAMDDFGDQSLHIGHLVSRIAIPVLPALLVMQVLKTTNKKTTQANIGTLSKLYLYISLGQAGILIAE
jgi:hypothetical protein